MGFNSAFKGLKGLEDRKADARLHSDAVYAAPSP